MCEFQPTAVIQAELLAGGDGTGQWLGSPEVFWGRGWDPGLWVQILALLNLFNTQSDHRHNKKNNCLLVGLEGTAYFPGLEYHNAHAPAPSVGHLSGDTVSLPHPPSSMGTT